MWRPSLFLTASCSDVHLLVCIRRTGKPPPKDHWRYLCSLSLGDRAIAGVVAAGIAAAYIATADVAAAAVAAAAAAGGGATSGATAAEGGRGLLVGTEAIGPGRWWIVGI